MAISSHFRSEVWSLAVNSLMVVWETSKSLITKEHSWCNLAFCCIGGRKGQNKYLWVKIRVILDLLLDFMTTPKYRCIFNFKNFRVFIVKRPVCNYLFKIRVNHFFFSKAYVCFFNYLFQSLDFEIQLVDDIFKSQNLFGCVFLKGIQIFFMYKNFVFVFLFPVQSFSSRFFDTRFQFKFDYPPT